MGIKILLADDHRLMRQGLRALLEEQPDITVAGEAENGKLAVQLSAKLMPDIIIMDISMPGLNGIDATSQILSTCSKSKVIALSMHTERRTVLEMLNAGASGYLLKDCAFEEVIQAVRTVAENNTYLSPKITEIVIKDYVNRIPKNEFSSLSGLTTREREVLQLLSEGKKTKEIAELLRVSIKTAESYRQQLMEKLNIHSIAELTKLAIREGITSL
ncbi:MAG TPA: response regulator transcription factor [Nitrospirota bacterium]|nr:response regulator transcription factor [Nitrospirota bacterium]